MTKYPVLIVKFEEPLQLPASFRKKSYCEFKPSDKKFQRGRDNNV